MTREERILSSIARHLETSAMNISEAMRLCADQGKKVRPLIWWRSNPDHWIESRVTKAGVMFVECGAMEEIPHALRLQYRDEFLGSWEEVTP